MVLRLPAIRGLIERRVLVNYAIDAAVLQRVLPAPFRVKQIGGYGIAGICLIRLARMRPSFWPAFLGLGSENAAHRIAVEWDTANGVREGVYVPRRDTNSALNVWLGGRLFPGEHHRAQFEVRESGDHVQVSLRSKDAATRVTVSGHACEHLAEDSVFSSVAEASAFFERGSIGYSATSRAGCFECLELRSLQWRVQPLQVTEVASSFFEDEAVFPAGSVAFDSALLMRGIEHEWHAHDAMQTVDDRRAKPRTGEVNA